MILNRSVSADIFCPNISSEQYITHLRESPVIGGKIFYKTIDSIRLTLVQLMLTTYKAVGTSGNIIRRYERGIITPSIEVIIKIADTLEVSIDFLVGKTSLEIDKQTIKRLEDISSLSEENKGFVLKMVDMARKFRCERRRNPLYRKFKRFRKKRFFWSRI